MHGRALEKFAKTEVEKYRKIVAVNAIELLLDGIAMNDDEEQAPYGEITASDVLQVPVPKASAPLALKSFSFM